MEVTYKVIEKDINQRLDVFCISKGISKKLIKDIKSQGDFLVNGKHQTVRYLTRLNDNITVILPKEKCEVVPINIPLTIIYEDEYLMIIDKPKGLPCIPTAKYYTHSLSNALSYYYLHHHIDSTIHLVNRLDKETSGYMLVAKSRMIHDYFSKDIKQVQRVYHCIVEGHVSSGTINAPIQKKKDDPIRREVQSGGAPSITHYRKIKDLGDNCLVECILETGRTHQIRVHMASIGHPLIGDELYNPNTGAFYLESREISFIHPITKTFIHYKKES